MALKAAPIANALGCDTVALRLVGSHRQEMQNAKYRQITDGFRFFRIHISSFICCCTTLAQSTSIPSHVRIAATTYLCSIVAFTSNRTEAEIHIKNFDKSLSIEKTQPPLIPSNPYNNLKMSTWSHPRAFEGGFDAHNFAPI